MRPPPSNGLTWDGGSQVANWSTERNGPLQFTPRAYSRRLEYWRYQPPGPQEPVWSLVPSWITGGADTTAVPEIALEYHALGVAVKLGLSEAGLRDFRSARLHRGTHTKLVVRSEPRAWEDEYEPLEEARQASRNLGWMVQGQRHPILRDPQHVDARYRRWDQHTLNQWAAAEGPTHYSESSDEGAWNPYGYEAESSYDYEAESDAGGDVAVRPSWMLPLALGPQRAPVPINPEGWESGGEWTNGEWTEELWRSFYDQTKQPPSIELLSEVAAESGDSGGLDHPLLNKVFKWRPFFRQKLPTGTGYHWKVVPVGPSDQWVPGEFYWNHEESLQRWITVDPASYHLRDERYRVGRQAWHASWSRFDDPQWLYDNAAVASKHPGWIWVVVFGSLLLTAAGGDAPRMKAWERRSGFALRPIGADRTGAPNEECQQRCTQMCDRTESACATLGCWMAQSMDYRTTCADITGARGGVLGPGGWWFNMVVCAGGEYALQLVSLPSKLLDGAGSTALMAAFEEEVYHVGWSLGSALVKLREVTLMLNVDLPLALMAGLRSESPWPIFYFFAVFYFWLCYFSPKRCWKRSKVAAKHVGCQAPCTYGNNAQNGQQGPWQPRRHNPFLGYNGFCAIDGVVLR